MSYTAFRVLQRRFMRPEQAESIPERSSTLQVGRGVLLPDACVHAVGCHVLRLARSAQGVEFCHSFE
jgi:hypothetical protein